MYYHLTGSIEKDFDKFLKAIDDSSNLTIFVDCNGGNSYIPKIIKLALDDKIEKDKNYDYKFIFSWAMSAACGLVNILPVEKCFAVKEATFMAHPYWLENWGNDHDFFNYAEYHKKWVNDFEHFPRLPQKVRDKAKKEQVWFGAEEALKWGLVSKII